jgi:hypothetical protein
MESRHQSRIANQISLGNANFVRNGRCAKSDRTKTGAERAKIDRVIKEFQKSLKGDEVKLAELQGK